MKLIKQRDTISQVNDPLLQQRILAEIDQLESCYEESYQASRHGWFAVFEQVEDCQSPLGTLPFSLQDKITLQEIEHVRFCPDYFEVLITLNDTEAVLVFIPEALAQHAGINVSLYQLAHLA